MDNIKSLSHLNLEREQLLLELDWAVKGWGGQVKQLKQILESRQKDHTTISHECSQNHQLNKQLAERQNSVIRLTSENMETTSVLQSKQHVKKQLARKLEELKETMELKSQEAQGLQQQPDQYLSHLLQYVVAYQQLTPEKEALHIQVLLLQNQLIDQLLHEKVQGKMAVEMSRQELQETQECLEATS